MRPAARMGAIRPRAAVSPRSTLPRMTPAARMGAIRPRAAASPRSALPRMTPAARMGALCLLAAACASAPIFPQTLRYASNSAGMALGEPLEPDRPSGAGFTLSVESSPGEEVRRLRDARGVEVKRWERVFSPTGELTEETVRDGEEIDAVRRYFASGLLKEELVYREGRPVGRFLFEYGENRPGAVRFSRPDGEDGYRDDYLFLPTGEFRGVQRHFADGKIYTSLFTTLEGLPWEEWHSYQGTEIFFRYDRRGGLLFQEERRDGKIRERVDFLYAPDPPHRLTERVARDLSADRETRLLYDREGRPERETLLERGERVAVTLFTYREGRLARKERRHRGGVQLWEYRHDDRGNLTAEYYTRNRELKKAVLYNPPPDRSRVEEFYKEGQVFLRVHYRDGEETRREPVGGGEE